MVLRANSSWRKPATRPVSRATPGAKAKPVCSGSRAPFFRKKRPPAAPPADAAKEKPAKSFFAGSPCIDLFVLFELHVVARENLAARGGDQNRRGVLACVEDNAFAQNFSRQVVPLVVLGTAAEP